MKLVVLSLLSLSLASCLGKKEEKVIVDMEEVKSNFERLPDSLIDREKHKDLIALGKKLYLEPKLSISDTISCNSCHKLSGFGVDNEPTSLGHDGNRGERNSPTSFNAALHIAQFWDGRAKDLKEQALGPILNPVEMGMPSEKAVIAKLSKIPGYKEEFAKAFPDEKNPLNYDNIGAAIEAFEKTLLTPSPFDAFLGGDMGALTAMEKKGLNRFMEIGCTACHNGVAIGGNDYQKLGLVHEFKTKDVGRFAVTSDPDDKHVFKVPSLRNVVQTGPYFHDGSIKSLDEAVKLMAHHQLGEKLDEEALAEIKAFLASLTGAASF